MITGSGGKEEAYMNKIANRYQTSHDKNIKSAMFQFRHYASIMNLSRQCKDLVKEIYSKAETTGKLKGKSFESKIAATIYMASKMCGRPKNLRELIEICR